MYRGYLQLGQTELANSTRTVTYMRNGVRNTSTEVVTDDSWPLLPWLLGRESEWSLPSQDDDCPWYDATDPASAEFAGVWPMMVEGLDADPIEREVVEAATDGGGFGDRRTPPRTITVEALLIAQTPAGLKYGIGWLNSVLREHEPRDLTFLNSAPPVDPMMSSANVVDVAVGEMRMVSSVVLTSELTVDEQFSVWTAEGRGATSARVSFELTAGVPWVWRLPQTLVEDLRPFAGVPQSVIFDSATPPELVASSASILTDPEQSPLTTLPRPVTSAAALGMYPIESKRLVWELEVGTLSRWFDTLPTVIVRTGASAERAVRIQWVPGIVTDLDADLSRQAVGEALIRYIPARATLTLDAVTGDATAVTSDGRVLDATPVTTGRRGGPWRAPVLSSTQTYSLVIDVERDVDPEVSVQVDALVRGQ